jgi:hypothetical protein
MNLTEAEKKQLRIHAANYMKLSDIAVILEKNVIELKQAYKDTSSEVYQVIKGERLKVVSEIQGSIITSAKNGSNPAQASMLDIINRINNKVDE